MEITLYGFGYVGRAIFNFLKDHYKIQVVDLVAQIPTEFPAGHKFCTDYENLEKTKYAILAVPTPMAEDGSCDTGIAEEVLKNTDHEFYLIKSTVPPGTVDRLAAETRKKICFSPEYIGEGKYVVQWWKNHPHPTDMKLHTFQIFGGQREVTKEFVNLFKRVLGPNATYAQTDAKTAELTKYMENSWGATKVIFCNEFAKIAEKFGVDYNELRELWALDGRVEKMHTLVFENKRGFGGKCFPKDVSAIIKASEAAGYEPKLLKRVLEVNAELQKENG